jgi:hypothetical protein
MLILPSCNFLKCFGVEIVHRFVKIPKRKYQEIFLHLDCSSNNRSWPADKSDSTEPHIIVRNNDKGIGEILIFGFEVSFGSWSMSPPPLTGQVLPQNF